MHRCLFIVLWLFALLCGAAGQAQKTTEPPFKKISTALAERLIAPAGIDSIDLMLALTKGSNVLSHVPFRVLQSYHNTRIIRIPKNKIENLIKDSNTVFADVVKTPKEELTTGSLDLAVNKINAAQAWFPGINGAGILASIKEQRFDTTDIDYAARFIDTHFASATHTTHASIMATTLAGAGNSSPFARGAAPAAAVTSTSFTSLLPEPDAYYQQFQITIQNHSYGTVPENYYGVEATAYDQSVASNPTLIHVFSAGNAGLTQGTGLYAALQGWSNLTGNFKTAKNCLVVGAIDSFYQVASASSKGPTFDGRIKPDLVAFGEDGSSGAAALTSGVVALLQQAYRQRHAQLPTAALVKAVLLNSADDVAQKGPDYASGYGSLNGADAVKTIVEDRFFEDSLSHGGVKKFVLTVPAHATQLKVTLAWTDTPAAVNAATALVNDVDLMVTNNFGESWLPWVLNAAPNVDSITQPAIRRRDTLNNVEQISIALPTPGSYTITIRGSRIETAVQPFAVAYQVDTAALFEWTFPTRNDPVVAGATNVLRWQTTDTGTAMLEYATNNGTWQALAAVALTQPFYKWIVPDTLATAQLRMRFSNDVVTLSDTFVISKATQLQVGFDCGDSVLLFWNTLPVGSYQLYNLNGGVLQPATTTNDTMVVLKKNSYWSTYLSVAPVVNGRAGLKSYTIDFTAQGVSCYFRSFYEQSQDDVGVTFMALLGTSYNIESLSLQKLQNNSFATVQTITAPTGTSFSFNDTQLNEGGNRYRLQIRLNNGAIINSPELSVFHFRKALVFVYPNPVLRGQTIMLRTNNGDHIRLRIFNSSGGLVRQFELNSITTPQITADLPAGVYFIEVTDDTGTRRGQKLVVY